MLKEFVFTGKTIDAAIETGLAELSMDRDDVSVEVLETPSKGLFRSTNAKIKIIFEAPDEAPEQAPIEKAAPAAKTEIQEKKWAKPEKTEKAATEVKTEIPAAPKKKIISSGDELSKKAEEFLSVILRNMGIDATVAAATDEETLNVEVSGDNMGEIIGRRGETLDALQYLTSLIVNKGKSDYVRVTIDTENYREKREETLVRLANKLAAKVLKNRRNVTLEPMNPYERRVIHSALQGRENISTSSIGVDPNRKVIIMYSGSDPAPHRPKSSGPRGDFKRDGNFKGHSDFKREQKPFSPPKSESKPKAEISDKELFNKMFGDKNKD